MTDEGSKGEGTTPSRWAAAGTIAETVYRWLKILVVSGGVLYGLPIFQAQVTKAHRDEAIAKAEIARREAEPREILDLDLSATLLSRQERDRHVLITLQMKNMGNRALLVPADRLNAYVARVTDIDAKGEIAYHRDRYPVRFHAYPDAALSELKIYPGERATLQAIQKVHAEGVHLISVEVGLESGQPGQAYRAALFTQLE